MGNFIYYEKLEDYEKQVERAKICDEKDKEVERLNNIINELEKWLKERSGDISFAYCHTLNKLQELKESKRKHNKRS